MEKEVKIFRKWNVAWANPLFIWGLFAADLANQEPNFVLKHSYFVCLARRREAEDQPAPAKYQLMWAGMRTDAEILAMLDHIPDAEYRGEIVGNFHSKAPGADVLRFTVSVPFLELYSFTRRFLTQIFREQPELGEAKVFASPRSADSRRGTGLAQAWSRNFAEHVQTGNTSGHMEVPQDLQQ
ncbi:hypothetical protein B0H19DRAFT_1234674 [Mycena capillaripes]|nr:hypothetical protein B0H19DRAFT_1234674 [Mycena capillaripes]